MIHLHVEPRVVKSWEEFVKESPAYSIALDGYVRAGPRYDQTGPRANFDHHEEVNRLCTRAACGQVYLSIKQGLFDTFNQDGEAHAHVYVNDPDQDVCMSVWLLRNFERLLTPNKQIEHLVYSVDLLDTTAGAYPIPLHSQEMGEIAWIFEPYTNARYAGQLPYLDAAGMQGIIDEVGERITALVEGRGQRLKVDTRYEIIGGGPGWLLVRELGPYARNKLFSQGMNAFVSVREHGDNRFAYSVGRKSTDVPFPVPQLLMALNRAEGLTPGTADAWAGSDIIGGAPRGTGSKLRPQEVAQIINFHLGSAPEQRSEVIVKE